MDAWMLDGGHPLGSGHWHLDTQKLRWGSHLERHAAAGRAGEVGHGGGVDPATETTAMTRRRPRDGDDGDDPATAATAPPTRSGHRSPCAARCGKVGDGGGGKVRDDVMGGAGDGATGADGAPDQTCPPPPVRCSLREGWRRRRWGGHGRG
uniref:Uncharacterized protein n=1 Tax=Oryza sativa subsp. japonica TaxID=39947 RepID=Q69K49_ORYSJ|nr:hypothetical protein [Oryza sativa Japonica Group]BAD36652.1 hypothetical protein [Oryza sativa Japonica Group]